ncbi:MAG: ABC transporter permease [Acidimicrobiales bacterium]
MKAIRAFGPALAVGLGALVAWEAAVVIFDIQEFLLPKPSSIFQALADEWPVMWRAGWETGKIAVTGLVVGVIAGVVMALLSTRFRLFGDAVTPLAVALNATPIIALAPIFNAWFGITDPRSNQAVVIVVVFFPVFINTARGLVEVAPAQLELMRSYASSEWTVMRRVRIPNALPFFLTSLRVVAPLSVIAAIVAEYFGGPQNRIGPVITQNASFARYDVAWAAIVVGSAVGLGLFVLAVVAERVLMPWKPAASN